MKACVYILQDDKDSFYIGSTRNLDQRLIWHKKGTTKTTKGMVNPRLVLTQEYESITVARKIENRIKNLKRKDYIQRMIKDGFIKLVI